MVCPWCGYSNQAAANFCGDCRRSLRLDLTCDRCGTRNPEQHRFCDACGVRIALSAETSAAPPAPDVRPDSPGARSPPRRRLLGLRWDTPVPRWEWSREYLASWVLRNRWELLAVALLTAVAAFLRVYRLADLPPGLHGDEAQTGLDALRILDEGWIGHYVGSAMGQPAGALYFTALVFWLSEASIFTLRLSMAILGIATVPVAYLLFRLGFGRWVALFGTAALTLSFWHLHFSRTGFMVVALPLIASLAAVAVLWAMRSRRRWPWLLSGVFLGAAAYSYSAYPMFLAAVALLLAAYVVLQRDQWRRLLAPLGLLLAGLVAVASPVILFALHSPDVYFSHTRQVSILRDPEFKSANSFLEKADYVADRTWDAVTVFYRHPELDGVDGLGGRGSLDGVIAVLAYMGLGISIAKWRSPPYLLAVLAVLAGMAAIVVTTLQGGDMRRSVAAIPFVFGLAGIGVVGVVSLSGRLLGGVGRKAAVGGAAVLLVATGAWNVRYYFGDLVQAQHMQWVFADDLVDSLQAAHRFDEPGTIYFYSDRWSYGYETRQFLFPDSRGIDRSREHGTFDLDRLARGPVTYVLIGDYEGEIDRLMEIYPGGEVVQDHDDGGGVRFAVYHLRESPGGGAARGP